MHIEWWISGIIFTATFALIFSEKVHRTIAGMAGAVAMLLAGKAFSFYSEEKAIRAIDLHTLGLLLGMMILVNILRRTGFFQYLAILAARKSRGKPWILLVSLGAVCTFVSMFMDNVTTIVLIAPLTIFIADLLEISPVPLLMAEALLSNTGGVATLVGDPPNILIASAANFKFNDFLVHLAPIVLVALIVTLAILLVVYRREMRQKPKNPESVMKMRPEDAITDAAALRKALIVIGSVILLFFIHHLLHLAPSLVALLGATMALLWVKPDINEVLHEVEWAVLLFFAALFVTVGGLESAGLLDAIAQKIAGLASSNLLLASIVMIWVAAIASAIVDNIPFTMAMIPVIQHIGSQGINVNPLWWALALGVGFGGNGTPIGSTASVITITLSEKTRTPITFKAWLRSGSIVMLATCVVATLLFLIFFRFMK